MSERRDTRVTAGVGVLVTIDGKTEPCMSGDISRGGIFILTHKKPPPGAAVDLTVVHANKKLTAKARVVSIKSQGLGLAFTEAEPGFGDAIRAMMNDLVAQASPKNASGAPELPRRAPRVYWSREAPKAGWKMWGRGPRDCELANLSLDGAAVHETKPPEVGETIVFSITGESGKEADAVSCHAKVVRHTETGYAVQFVTPTVEFRQAVTRMRRQKFMKKP